MKQKFKSYTFWVGLVSAIILVIEEVCKLFGLVADVGIIENVLLSICGVFVVLGILTKDRKEDKKEDVIVNEEIFIEDTTLSLNNEKEDIKKKEDEK